MKIISKGCNVLAGFVEKYYLILIVLFFTSIYTVISLGKHFVFKSSALDLGLFNQVMFNISVFNEPFVTALPSGESVSFFYAHFSPILYLYIPFYYLFGSYSLLIIQIFSVVIGGIGVVKLSNLITKNSLNPVFPLVFFYGLWGVVSALFFDFHNNVVGAMLVTWLIFFLYSRKYFFSVLVFLLIIISKENMSLWLFFIMIVLLWEKDKKKLTTIEFLFLVFSIVYFVVVMTVVMPYFGGQENASQVDRYVHIGDSFSDIIINLFTDPIHTIGLLFGSFTDEFWRMDVVKIKLYFVLVLSGGYFFVKRPIYLIMIMPIVAQKMLSNDSGLWGIHNQYSIEFVPVLTLLFIKNYKYLNPKALFYVLGGAFIATLFTISDRKFRWFETKIENNIEMPNRVTENITWNKGGILDIYEGLDLIPNNASVSASSSIVPHIAFRKKIFLFPVVKNSEFIVLHNTNSSYPITKPEFNKLAYSYINDKLSFEEIYNKGNLIILKRISF